MPQRLDPPGPARAHGGDRRPNGAPGQRVFPRIKFAKNIEVAIGPNKYYATTYDVSQGGLSFVASDAVETGQATIKISDTYVFEGMILARHNAGKPGVCRFHFQFMKSLELPTLAGVLGSQ